MLIPIDFEVQQARAQRAVLLDGWKQHIEPAHWTHFVTLTFRWSTGPDRAELLFNNKLIRSLELASQHAVSWFRSIEGYRYDNTHVHALIYYEGELNNTRLAKAWSFGRTDVELYDRERGAVSYMMKEAWWEPEFDRYDISPRLLKQRCA